MWKFSKQKDNGRHSFIRLDYDIRAFLCPDASYLSECGVLGTFIFAWGLSTTFYQINESAPHFLVIYSPYLELGGI